MDIKHIALLAFQISLITTVFSFGLAVTPVDLKYLAERPALLTRSLIAIFVVMPVVAVVIGECFDFPHGVEIAIVALAVSPLPPRLPAREAKAGGAQSYGLGLMVLLSVLSVGTVPLAAYLLGLAFGRTYTVAPGSIAALIATTVLVPLAMGVVIRFLTPGVADRLVRPLAQASRIIMPAAGITLLTIAAPALWHLIVNGTLVAIIIFLLAGFAAGHALVGPARAHSSVLAFSTACRHPGIALSLAAANFPDERFGATILLYLCTAYVLGMGYSTWLRRRSAGSNTVGGDPR